MELGVLVMKQALACQVASQLTATKDLCGLKPPKPVGWAEKPNTLLKLNLTRCLVLGFVRQPNL